MASGPAGSRTRNGPDAAHVVLVANLSASKTTQGVNAMGNEDVAAGKVKQVKGKANDIAGAVKGDTGQQIKGKAQQVAGKVQESIGKAMKDKK
jgi:uncharacterized protein YjbJ (UPF0337 family)